MVNPQRKPGTAKYGGGVLGGLARTFNPLQSIHLGGKNAAGPNQSIITAPLGTGGSVVGTGGAVVGTGGAVVGTGGGPTLAPK